MDKKKAFVPKRIGKQFKSVELGTKEGTILLQNPKIDMYSVELLYEQELTLFIMKRRKDDVWVAHREGEGPGMRHAIGKSREINYKKIDQVWNFFMEKKKKKQRSTVRVDSE